MKLQKNLLHISRRAVMTLAFGASALLLGAVAMVSAYGTQLDDPSASDVHRGGDDSTFVVEVKTISDNYAQNDIDPAEGNLAFSRGDTFLGDGIIYTDGSIPGGSGAEPINGARKLGEYVQRGVTTTSSNQFEKAVAGVRAVSPHIEFATELFTFRDGSTILTDG